MRRDVFQAMAEPKRWAITKLIAPPAVILNAIAGHFDNTRKAIFTQLRVVTECALTTQGQYAACEKFIELFKISK